ncbi:DUF3899 domain-containing protein [Pediococcus ethanolidurans]|uniref:DUF3899 domain-containing protein n=1 Tax=Pediococcus ethanolidurans TaxID=319653 RepID=A0A1H9NJQ3_9LACO|nr:DUF3899 domain-containing protein [Pediococcus ethanolidurans]MBU7554587.1 DUF3899 domain-containing protein [Pediococcus ethanolidurans]MBU7563335.1 DUF3899 domain-containing protein [Pediococcus ethanolidurans]MCV3315290.1 DUF3899 domain-containing protein [Pediococcus ethanolidurans]MCV3323248.1 DUF3899 domain-containing protein [Pediococcus ethanolidurans]MCV3327550.1 DUF3899 domain-containing protein [Pediococcus ethanolidurans]
MTTNKGVKITNFIKAHKALTTDAVLVLIGFIDWLITRNTIVTSNHFFMVGLALLLIGVVFVLERGHLFTGWFKRPAKGEEKLPQKKIDVHKVGRIKNSPIVLTKPARYFLHVGIFTVVVSILVSFI